MCVENPVEPEKKSEWVSINETLPNTTVQAIASDNRSSSSIWIGTFDGVFKTVDGGKSWNEASDGLTGRDVTCLAVHPEEPDRVFCGTWGKGVFESRDGGRVWQSIWPSDNNPLIRSLCLSTEGRDALWAATESALFQSGDSGQNWQRFLHGDVLSVAVDPGNPLIIYAGVRYAGQFKSIDGGESWDNINEGISKTSDGYPTSNCFTINPSNTDEIVMSTGWIDLYKSITGGTGWFLIAEPLRKLDVISVVIDPLNPSNLWAATSQNGVYRSDDGGLSWRAFNAGLLSTSIRALKIVEGEHATVLVGTSKGIYKYSGK
jgi:photosystem II stability/assembly factor-like uncharacterized protein